MRAHWRQAFLAVVFLTLAVALGVAQEAANPSLGKWKLNVEKSKSEPSPLYKGEDRTYEDWGGGLVHAAFPGVDMQDQPTFREYVARLDGRDYPWVRRGAKTAWTIALKAIDGRSFAYTAKEDGKVVQTGTHTVSVDDKVMTVTYKVERPNAQGQLLSGTLVFDKQ